MAKAKMVYVVLILRQDQNHIEVMQSDNYKLCYEKWKTLQTEWATASKEQRPFVLEDPVVTAFTPSMVYEIKVTPLMMSEMNQDAHNPYQKRMMESGFSNMNPGGSGIDLLSR